MTAEDLAPEPARTIRERLAACDAAARMGAVCCHECLTIAGIISLRRLREFEEEHADCLLAFFNRRRVEMRVLVAKKYPRKVLDAMNAGQVRLENTVSFNGRKFRVRGEATIVREVPGTVGVYKVMVRVLGVGGRRKQVVFEDAGAP